MKIETNSRKSITLDLTFFLLLISNYLSRKLDFLTGITISNAITHDKKARGQNLKIILLEKIGQAKVQTIPIKEMNDYLKEGD